MPIYTRTGDKGKTSFFGGKRIWKSDPRIEICGTIDELNSLIGVVLSGKHQILSIKKELIRIQNDLLNIGSSVANQKGVALESLNYRVKEFEDFIDQLTVEMPVLKNFILPGGGKTGAMLHLARAICRRAEREIVKLNVRNGGGSRIIVYMNRLSDLLFTIARFVNFKEKKKEIIWRKND